MNNKPVDRVTLLNVTIFVEAFLLLAATIWSQISRVALLKSLHFDYKLMLIGIACGIAMAFSGLGLFYLTRKIKMFSQLRDLVENYLRPMVADLNPPDLFTLSALSGFCEEVFFRGVIQPQFGLPITSLAFGLFHDPSFRNISYSIIAAIYGLVLGALYQHTGNNLWAPIFAHATHNLISLYALRYWIRPPASPIEEGSGQ